MLTSFFVRTRPICRRPKQTLTVEQLEFRLALNSPTFLDFSEHTPSPYGDHETWRQDGQG
jgi:hypothetical protein